MRRTRLLLLCATLGSTSLAGAAQGERSTERLLDSTVCIAGDAGGAKFESSGFAVAPGNRIVTTAHGIEGVRNLRVKLHDGRMFPARVERLASNQIDLALLEVIGARLEGVELATVEGLKAGQEVSTIGCPRGFDFSVTRGVVSSLRDVGLRYPMIQTDVPVNPGSSGGALFDAAGRVVGIIKSSAVDRDRINFALPVDFLRTLIEESDRQREGYELFNRGIAATSPAEKVDLYGKAIALLPELIEARYNLALALEGLGRVADAEREYRELLRIDPGNELGSTNLGVELYQQRRFGDAIVVYEEALKRHPDSIAIRNNLAETYRASGDVARARKEFEALVKQAPDYAPAHYGLGVLFDDSLHDPKRAAKEYRRYLELAPDANDAPRVREWLRRSESTSSP